MYGSSVSHYKITGIPMILKFCKYKCKIKKGFVPISSIYSDSVSVWGYLKDETHILFFVL